MNNKEKYNKEIKALRVILSDDRYWNSDKEFHKDQTFKSFLSDMHTAMVGNRTVTPKMKAAIDRAIKNYNRRSEPKFLEKVENIVLKLTRLSYMAKECGYTKDYEHDRVSIIDGMIRQANAKGTLSKRQMGFCNNMYKQFKKRIEKVRNST